MKRIIALILLLNLLFCSCSSNNTKYKRIDISVQTLDGEKSDLEQTVNWRTKIESTQNDIFTTTMPVYEITPLVVSRSQLKLFAEHLGVYTNSESDFSDTCIETEHGTVSLQNDNYLYYSTDHVEEPMTQSDDDLVEEAKRIFNALPIFEGEYECMGVQSVQTLTESDELSYIVSKRIAFRKVIDGVRVLGNEICNLYFDADGLYTIRMELYNYTKVGEIPMLSLDDAIDKIKDADAFSVDADETTFSGVADKLTVERVKLLYVNQYSEGCTILQPVFNLMGTAENDSGTAEFSAKIIAIPEKYTYEDD